MFVRRGGGLWGHRRGHRERREREIMSSPPSTLRAQRTKGGTYSNRRLARRGLPAVVGGMNTDEIEYILTTKDTLRLRSPASADKPRRGSGSATGQAKVTKKRAASIICRHHNFYFFNPACSKMLFSVPEEARYSRFQRVPVGESSRRMPRSLS